MLFSYYFDLITLVKYENTVLFEFGLGDDCLLSLTEVECLCQII